MYKAFVYSFVSLVFVSTLSCSGGSNGRWATLWSRGYGDIGNEAGLSIAVSDLGDVLVAGKFDGTIDFGGGPLTSAGGDDIFVLKLDATGNHVWSSAFGGVGRDRAFGIAVGSTGDVLITGEFANTVDFGGGGVVSAGLRDIFVVKLDANGNHLWSSAYGDSSDDEGRSVAVDDTGAVLIAGGFAGTVDFGAGAVVSAGMDDIFVLKLDANGNHIWSRAYGGTGRDEAFGVAAGASGDPVVTGEISATVDFGGGGLTSAGNFDSFILKLDVNGNHLWSNAFGSSGKEFGYGVALDSVESVVFTGNVTGAVDFGGGALANSGAEDVFVAKFDVNGNHVWSKTFGDTGTDHGRSVAVHTSGGVTVTGGFSGSVDFGGGNLPSIGLEDIFVVQLNGNGNHICSDAFGDSATDTGFGVAVDAIGTLFVTGQFSGTVDFGKGPITGAGGEDAFAMAIVR